MIKFMEREYDVLVCTNIVESGLDVPNANTIVINNAHFFGLSELHQLRGRVGRSNKKAFCYLFTPPLSSLTSEARKRLKTIEEFSDLGSGFNISLRDMDIRGAGNLLGGEQSGFIAEIGFDMYHKILDEAIRELKQTEYKEIYEEELNREQDYVRDCQIDTDLEMLIPDYYIRNINERLSIYTELDNVADEEKLQQFKTNLKDRFGEVPKQVEELFNGLRLRWVAKRLGFERIVFKTKKLKCYFIENPESYFYETPVFGKIMAYVQNNPKKCSVKQTNKSLILTFENIKTMQEANELLNEVNEYLKVS
jgi:transcription-repair coupling factor (superfamily II helicase)